jgi:iron complex outermembrane receptor protein
LCYYTKKKNFVSGVERVSPVSVYQLPDGTIPILDENELAAALTAGIAGNPGLAPALGLFGLAPEQVAGLLVALGDQGLPGSDGGLRELMESLPAGVVQPDQNQVPGEILNAYRNFGDIDFWGIDAAIQVLATDRLTLFGNVSYISDDFFDNKDLGEDNPASPQALITATYPFRNR